MKQANEEIRVFDFTTSMPISFLYDFSQDGGLIFMSQYKLYLQNSQILCPSKITAYTC